MAEERSYELIFICRPDTPEADLEKVISTLRQTIEEHQGRLERVDKWGVKKLAYRLGRSSEGFFVFVAFYGRQGDLIRELERRLKVSEPVLKYLTVRIDQEMKRKQKLSARRERRLARRPRKAPAEQPAAG